MNDNARISYRTITEFEQAQVLEIKSKGQALIDVMNTVKPGREMSLAKTKTEEAIMWAVKGITG